MAKRFIKISRKDSTLAAMTKSFYKDKAKRNPGKFVRKYVRKANQWTPDPNSPYTGFK